ncbi:carboxymuconolactone decarboxylase family protein [Gallaecimonas sp. GXIMD4217]|uniref:carboxymuconolactone decarboxylase family protein n=1 Tax=Gallaecimonas sp. GXIMD4217 TaxID=3131927 RepID=UPI00311B31AD
MPRLPAHDLDSAPQAARPHLEKALSSLGFVPNLYAQLAEAPTTLEAYLTLNRLFEQGSLDARQRQLILLVTSVENGCGYCVPAHSVIAKQMAGVPAEVVAAVREGQPLSDARLEALRRFTLALLRHRGKVPDLELQAFLDAGHSQAQALEVVLGITIKTLSNYANRLAGTLAQPEFAAEAWTPRD